MRRNRLIAAVIAGVTVSAGAGWGAATTIKSPAQAAAEKEPPSASPITAPVERRELSSTVTARGTVRYGQPEPVTLATSTYRGQQSSLVTKPATKGAVVGENAVVMEVNGRPVRALTGAVPMYRDIRPGDRGEDVRQLEAALERLGFAPGKVDGVYDARTAGAVEAWYRASGYEAEGATDEQREQLRNAHSAVSNAEAAVLQAKDALNKVRKGITAKDVRQAENEVRASARNLERAQDDLKAAQGAEDLARLAESSTRLAEGVTRDADAKVAADNRLSLARADADVAAAEHRLDEAELAERVAEQKLEEDTAAGAPESQLEADRLEVERAENAVDEAETNLDTAELAEDAAIESAEHATRQANLETVRAAQATRQAELATLQTAQATVAAHRAIDAGRDAAALADATLALVKEPPDEEIAKASLTKAETDLADARGQERELASEIGIVVPANEVLFFPALPLRVDEAKVDRGDDATQEVMVVTTSRLAIDGALSIPDARLVSVGDRVDVTDTQLGLETTGTVSEVASKPGTDGVDAQQVYVEIIPEDAPEQLTGASVALSIAVTSTKGKVLAVPVAAVTVDGSGSSRVRVVDAGGTRRVVPVRTGLAAEGFVEVTPSKGVLEPGDRVLVGKST